MGGGVVSGSVALAFEMHRLDTATHTLAARYAQCTSQCPPCSARGGAPRPPRPRRASAAMSPAPSRSLARASHVDPRAVWQKKGRNRGEVRHKLLLTICPMPCNLSHSPYVLVQPREQEGGAEVAGTWGAGEKNHGPRGWCAQSKQGAGTAATPLPPTRTHPCRTPAAVARRCGTCRAAATSPRGGR